MRLALALGLMVACGVPEPSGPGCLVSELEYEEWRPQVGRFDVLFVVDTSPGMAPYLERLRALIPRLFAELTYLDSPLNEGRNTTDLHIGVVSADMGLAGSAAVGCSAPGADGVLQPGSCAALPDRFVWYYPLFHDLQETLATLDCQFDLKTSRCAVAEPLEAALKALWPTPEASGMISFADGSRGHGADQNRAFLRPPVYPLWAGMLIVFVTNQDDASCGAHGRCADQPGLLESVSRYVDGLRALRPADDDVWVNAVVLGGIPPDLLEEQQLWDTDNVKSAYDALLADPRMQSTTTPSCTHAGAPAYAPRRLVQFAQQLGYYHATLGSICDDDLMPAFLSFFNRNQSTLLRTVSFSGDRCLVGHKRVPRAASGLMPCTMTWELPTTRESWRPLTPIACDERPAFLSVPQAPSRRIGPHGGALCEVRQVPVHDPRAVVDETEVGPGFFIEPPSRSRHLPCNESDLVTFTKSAKPPEGVWIRLRCSRDAPRAESGLAALPDIGAPCDIFDSRFRDADDLCKGGSWANSPTGAFAGKGEMFCHPDKHVCVMGCSSDADCLAGWLCDVTGVDPLAASAGRPMCINPGCW